MPIMRYLDSGPVSDLYLAINHYISTGDYIGAGHALEDHDGNLYVLVPYDPENVVDAADASLFKARIGEIVSNVAAMGIQVTLSEQKRTPGDPYSVITVIVPKEEAVRLAQELVRSPGAGTWGSLKPLIDRHFASVRGKILSGEGA